MTSIPKKLIASRPVVLPARVPRVIEAQLRSQHDRVADASGRSGLRYWQAVNGSRKPQQVPAAKDEINADCHADKVGARCRPRNEK
jgi:hypothetical protein